MSELLKCTEFEYWHHVPEMDDRPGRIDPKLDAERSTELELSLERLLINDPRDSSSEEFGGG